MPTIYLSPERRPKPHGKYWDMEVYEKDVCTEIAEKVKTHLETAGFSVIMASESQTIMQRATWANNNGVDYYLVIHTNASADGTEPGTATGTEMLVYQADEAIRANQLIYDEVTKLHPSNRGLKNGNNYIENNQTKMVSAYIEIGFHDNPSDVSWILSCKDEIAHAIATGVAAYYGVSLGENQDTTEDTEDDTPADTGESITLEELRQILNSNGITHIII